METLTARFPQVLFEGCAGGGGRFDAGMLCYTPQIWCSDDTDAIERLTIQRGTAYGYPLCTMGSHVSAAPNHQTGRTTPLHTRAVVAMSGAFGYELDLSKLSREEKEEIREQIRRFHEDEALMRAGSYYRLGEFTAARDAEAWLLVSPDQSRALLNLVVTAPTCGSCGVLPAVLYYMRHDRGFPENEILDALAVAGLIGNVIRTNASISGAECGCQAEIGSACSMTAAALATLFGMNIDQVEYAAEIAMEHNLGLTCDPVNGLVQIPCIERNAVAAMRAVSSVNLSRFLYETRKISFDEVVATMYRTGRDMDEKYRETSHGGLAKLYSDFAPVTP
jgi:hypothetical protein